MELTEK